MRTSIPDSFIALEVGRRRHIEDLQNEHPNALVVGLISRV